MEPVSPEERRCKIQGHCKYSRSEKYKDPTTLQNA